MHETNELIATVVDDTFDVKLFSLGSDVKKVKISFVNREHAEPLYIDFDKVTKDWRIRMRNWRTDNIETVRWIDGRIR